MDLLFWLRRGTVHPPPMPVAETEEGRLASRMAIFLLSFLVAMSSTGIALVVAFVGTAPPRVLLGDAQNIGGSYRFEIRSASNVRPLGEFAAAVQDSAGNEVARLEHVVAWSSGPRGTIFYLDGNGDGRMNPGDSFGVFCMSPGEYSLELYREGVLVDAARYTVNC